jgi:hypothetical protein
MVRHTSVYNFTHLGGSGLDPDQVMLNLLWTKRYSGRFSPTTSVSHANHFTDCSTHDLLFGVGTIGQIVVEVTSGLRRMASSRMLRRVALVRTDVSEELSAFIITVTRIGELGTLAVTSNRHTLRRFLSP